MLRALSDYGTTLCHQAEPHSKLFGKNMCFEMTKTMTVVNRMRITFCASPSLLTTDVSLLVVKMHTYVYMRKDGAMNVVSCGQTLAYHPRGKEDRRYLPIFISASWDDSIQVWHDQQGSSLWQIYGTYVAGNDGLDIDPTKNIILTCSWRRENSLVQLWPFPNFLIEGEREITERENMSYKRPLSRFVYEPLKQVTRGYVAKFDAHYKLILYAGSNKNLVSILDIENNTVIAEVTHLDNGVYSGAVFRDPETPDQLRIIYTSGKGVSLGKINMNI
ncbi:hypothetical protein T265_10959 [Opisthorchis viverrini]|uniref:WD domain, G-beta repeat protein n=1 Tax=Opisthorchis viverrini TaxID=6198 RepID=A0A074Z0E3_OPIVI|nr:hypothetical protein T265_10959 [Opisthorchis viverrini]KER20511.1 hypothetical protein T265_10959 [Opisthorchis viverrini]